MTTPATPERELAFRMAAASLAVRQQGDEHLRLVCSVKVALYHLRHGRLDAADRVLRDALEGR